MYLPTDYSSPPAKNVNMWRQVLSQFCSLQFPQRLGCVFSERWLTRYSWIDMSYYVSKRISQSPCGKLLLMKSKCCLAHSSHKIYAWARVPAYNLRIWPLAVLGIQAFLTGRTIMRNKKKKRRKGNSFLGRVNQWEQESSFWQDVTLSPWIC